MSEPNVAWDPETRTVWVRVYRRADVDKVIQITYTDGRKVERAWFWTPVPVDPPMISGGGSYYRRDLPPRCVRLEVAS